MARFLEGLFVFGSSLVGFALSAGEGSAVHQLVRYAIHFAVSGWNGAVGARLL